MPSSTTLTDYFAFLLLFLLLGHSAKAQPPFPNSDFETGSLVNCACPTGYFCVNDAGRVVDGFHPVFAVGNNGCVVGGQNYTNSLSAYGGTGYVYFYAGADAITTPAVSFVGGETICLSVWYAGPQGAGASGQNTASCYFRFGVDGIQVGPSVPVPVNTGWTQHSFNVIMTAGIHSFDILSGNAAQYSIWFDDFTVTPGGPVVSAGSDVTICGSANTTLSASGGTGYAWSPATGLSNPNISNPVASPVSTTTYVVTVSNTCGSATDTVVVTVNSSITASISGNTTVCTGGSTTLSASGGTNYSWSNNTTNASVVLSPTSTSTYSVFVTSGLCADTASVTVTALPAPAAFISGSVTLCSGQSATLTASGGNTYSWIPGGQTTSSLSVSPLSSTTYSVIASIGSCTDTASATVTVLPLPSASIAGNTTICSGNSATLTASGGGTYAWNTAATTSSIVVSPAATTNYSVVVTGVNGCITSATGTVTVFLPATASITGNTSLCQGDSALLTASGGGNYSWSTGETTASITVSSAGNYSVFVSAGTCSDTAATTVVVNPNPIASAGVNVSISQGASATLTVTGGGTYLWNNGESSASITVTPSTTTIYCVTVSDANNCTDISCVTVYVEPLDCSGEIYLPNAFSPNGDLENDELQIYYGNFLCIKFLQISIYNRWGENVFFAIGEPSSGGEIFSWDGTYKNKISDSGVYTYYMNANLQDGKMIDKRGNISLIR